MAQAKTKRFAKLGNLPRPGYARAQSNPTGGAAVAPVKPAKSSDPDTETVADLHGVEEREVGGSMGLASDRPPSITGSASSLLSSASSKIRQAGSLGAINETDELFPMTPTSTGKKSKKKGSTGLPSHRLLFYSGMNCMWLHQH